MTTTNTPPDQMIVNVQFNVPRYIVATPGKQNRACTGYMRITPGVFEAFEFVYSNTDGVPINLTGFKLRVVFWFPQAEYELLAANLQGNILLAKDAYIDSPYEGIATMVLTDQETIKLAQTGRSSIRWSVYMINSDGSVYPTQITANGERYGIVHIDRSEVPNAETVKGITVSK